MKNDRQSELVKKALSSSVRAISNDPNIEITFTPDNTQQSDSDLVQIPIPSREPKNNEIFELRGIGDSKALKIKYHDKDLHLKNLPKGDLAIEVYNAIERVRYESIGSKKLSGVSDNLSFALEKSYENVDKNENDLEERNTLSDAIRLFLREQMTGSKPPKSANKIYKKWKNFIKEHGSNTIKDLSKNIYDQKSYSLLSKKLLSELNLIENTKTEINDEDNENSSNENDREQDPNEITEENEEQENSELIPQDTLDENGHDTDEVEEKIEDSSIDTNIDQTKEQNNRNFNKFDKINEESFYKIFTSEFDQIENAENLCDQEELGRLRSQLDDQMQNHQSTITKLANKLQRKLLAKQNRSWNFDLEEGILDAARLTRVIVNPTFPLSYKMESPTNFKDTIVTLLIDNSGSMRGRPITVAAMCGDILARTLERCGVNVEILGFTTVAWKGGKTREKWLTNNKPNKPGRLNDIRHIIYKAAEQPWRRSKKNLGLMLKEGILKENIDGEALIWACNRLNRRYEQRKILMVISDGAPVDDSTLSVNYGDYLDKHLHEVIYKIENYSMIELIAIGIGHDVTRYYNKALTLIDAEQLGGAMIDQLASLFED
ncbi:MAG: cobaltochelatase subunit CobT [Rhodospirillaceae bacterium]|nr:cobaltochelatase subunit CobT [Rhodospirillaceae bacterium]